MFCKSKVNLRIHWKEVKKKQRAGFCKTAIFYKISLGMSPLNTEIRNIKWTCSVLLSERISWPRCHLPGNKEHLWSKKQRSQVSLPGSFSRWANVVASASLAETLAALSGFRAAVTDCSLRSPRAVILRKSWGFRCADVCLLVPNRAVTVNSHPGVLSTVASSNVWK